VSYSLEVNIDISKYSKLIALLKRQNDTRRKNQKPLLKNKSTILVSVMNTKNYVNRTFTTVSKKIVQLILLQYVKNTWLCGKKQQSIDVFLSVIRITNVPHRPRAKTLLENCLGK
jgi:hypothetical protein